MILWKTDVYWINIETWKQITYLKRYSAHNNFPMILITLWHEVIDGNKEGYYTEAHKRIHYRTFCIFIFTRDVVLFIRAQFVMQAFYITD